MKQRLLYLIKLFAAFVIFFLLQKIIFAYCNAENAGVTVSVNELLLILKNGMGLDASTGGYLVAIPFLITWISIVFSKIRAKIILAPYFVAISLILSAICVVDTSLYEFWGFKLDATIFNYIDSPKEAFASVSAWYIAIRVILTLICTCILSYICIRITPAEFEKSEASVIKKILQHVYFIITGGIIFLCIRGGVGRSTMNIGTAYYSNTPYYNHSAVNPAFNLFYSWRKTEDFGEKYNYLSENERAAIYNTLYGSTGNKCDSCILNNKRPNILLVILEGFGGYYIEALGGKKDVSPNFMKLIGEGVFFNNVYANSFRTDRGLVSTLSGHISYPTTSIMKIPAKTQKLPGLAGSLSEAGYSTDFVYGGDINFTNMKSYLTTIGYQNITADINFSLKERTSSSWGAHDEYTFAHVLKMIKQMPDEKKWHISLLTLSSHEPFEVPYNRFSDKRLNSFAYTDHCLGEFISELKKLPEWKDLLVICMPDHGTSPNFNVTSPDFYHIPMLWLGGAVSKPMTVDKLMNQSDMPATLLAQLGIGHDEYIYSRNIMSEDYKYPFAYSTYSDGIMFKDSTGCTIFDNAAQKVVFNDTADDNSISIDRENKAKAILQTSYDYLNK